MSTTSDLMGQGMPAAVASLLGTAIDAKAATAGQAFTGNISSTGSITATANLIGKYVQGSVGNALTAAGTTRADALALTNSINNVTTAAASTGVILPSAATVGIGGSVVIFNAGASAAKVYAAGSDTIDGTAGATGVTLTNAKRCVYVVVAAATFVSAQMGVVSA